MYNFGYIHFSLYTHTHIYIQYSDGAMPYTEVKNTEIRRKIKRGLRLTQPDVGHNRERDWNYLGRSH